MLNKRHPFFRRFHSLLSEVALHPPTYDLGTNLRFAKEVGLVRNLFDENQYFAGGYHPDLQTGPDACNFDCDIQVLANIKDCAAGSVLCLTVLEHVIDPQAAVRQIYRILKPGGVAVISVPFFISYHGKSETHTLTPQLKRRAVDVDSGHDSYGDFWRFTHEGLCVLFANAGFSVVNVYPVDGPLISRLQVLGLYRIIENLPLLNSLVARMDRPRLGKMTTMHFVRATK